MGHPFSSPFWLTFRQTQELKGTVRKGEKGTPIVFFKQLCSRPEDEERDRASFVLCYYRCSTSSNAGLTRPLVETSPVHKLDRDECCEAIVEGWKNRPALHLTSETESRAYYRPNTDSIHMPARARFVDASHYYSTLFHELVHSTGHESRFDRTFGARFGNELYTKEELVAEMGAVFLCAVAGIADERTNRNNTAYIQNWSAKLEDDNRLVIYPAAHAQKDVDSILGTRFDESSETDATGEAAESSSLCRPSHALAA